MVQYIAVMFHETKAMLSYGTSLQRSTTCACLMVHHCNVLRHVHVSWYITATFYDMRMSYGTSLQRSTTCACLMVHHCNVLRHAHVLWYITATFYDMCMSHGTSLQRSTTCACLMVHHCNVLRHAHVLWYITATFYDMCMSHGTSLQRSTTCACSIVGSRMHLVHNQRCYHEQWHGLPCELSLPPLSWLVHDAMTAPIFVRRPSWLMPLAVHRTQCP